MQLIMLLEGVIKNIFILFNKDVYMILVLQIMVMMKIQYNNFFQKYEFMWIE